jgi:hypothetical protein
VLERLPFPVQVIQTDNGAEFQSAFHYHVSVTRSSSHPRARVGRDGAASGYAPCSHALRIRRGPKPTARPHEPWMRTTCLVSDMNLRVSA